ncbi:hypothetical protein DVP71_16925 [Yersinia enterocolitica]|nr:hypothetical protein [Yersinia enterocolitica]
MKLTFSNSTMDVIMQECRRNGVPVTTFINKLVDAEAERIRSRDRTPKISIEGEINDRGSAI